MNRFPIILGLAALLSLAACGSEGGEEQTYSYDFVPWEEEDTTGGGEDTASVDTVAPPEGCNPSLAGEQLRLYFSRPVDKTVFPDGAVCGSVNLGRKAAEYIDDATDSIDIASMQLEDDLVVSALGRAAKRGLAIRFFMDDSYWKPAEYKELADLQTKGVKFKTDAADSPLMHNKFMVLDGQRLWTGTANFSNYCSTSNANSMLLFDDAAVAGHFTARFERLWGGSGTGDSHQTQPAGKSFTVGGVPVSVFFSPSATVVTELQKVISSAKSKIHFEIFSFTLKEVRTAINAKCGKVEIVGIYDPSQAQQGSVLKDGWCSDMTFLPAALPDKGGYNKLHHKTLIVDPGLASAAVATGSFNWTWSAAQSNDETFLILRDPELALAYEAEFQARLAESVDASK